MLRLVDRRLINEEKIPHEFAVPRLHPIAIVHIVCVRNGPRAGSLNYRARAQSLSIGEVGLQRQAVPISCLHRRKRSVIVAPPIADAHGDSGSQLAILAQWIPRNRCVHHGTREGERTIVEVAPKTPHGIAWYVARAAYALIRRHGCCATRVARAVGRLLSTQRCFKERLRRQTVWR